MTSSSHPSQPFRVVFSPAIAKGIRELQRLASREGRGEEFLAAFRKVKNRLRDNPTYFGEPLYRLPALRLRVRCVVIGPLGVHFAVHEEQPVAFISNIKLLSKRSP